MKNNDLMTNEIQNSQEILKHISDYLNSQSNYNLCQMWKDCKLSDPKESNVNKIFDTFKSMTIQELNVHYNHYLTLSYTYSLRGF